MNARVAMMAKSPSVSRSAVMTAQGMTQGITQAAIADMPTQVGSARCKVRTERGNSNQRHRRD